MIFICDVSYFYTKGRYPGGSVYVFVEAATPDAAQQRITEKMEEQGLKVRSFDSISPYAGSHWGTRNLQKHFDTLAKAATSGQIVFDDFYAYEKE